MSEKRLGESSLEEVDQVIENCKPENTKRNRQTVWKQFNDFCKVRQYELLPDTPIETIASILKEWALNMRKSTGEEYKEYTVKTMWNVTAKILQETYMDHKRIFNPFVDIEFKAAREARNAKRRQLQKLPEKRKVSSVALNPSEYNALIDTCDENTPKGLQMKFFHIASLELGWRGGEAAKCLTHHFQEELTNNGSVLGRVAYNPIFSKTFQSGDQKLADTKWLIPNPENPDKCSVRLYKLLVSKRPEKVQTNRFFLTPNPFYHTTGNWYKDSPVGVNEISSWMKISAEKAGLGTKRRKITNHSSRSTTIAHMSHGVQEQVLIKTVDHSDASALEPYLQMNEDHHSRIITPDISFPTDKADELKDTKDIKVEQTLVSGNLKVYPIRLHPGTEIKSALKQLIMDTNLKAAFVLTCCGSIKKATLRFATDKDLQERVQTLNECFEITSLVGTVCKDGAHLHVTLGRYDGSTLSGHVLGDLIVQTTAEIVLGEISGAVFERRFDENTGWRELYVSKDSEFLYQ